MQTQTLVSAFLATVSWLGANMSYTKDHAQDWLLGKVLSWPEQPAVNKVDTHHHFVPHFYRGSVVRQGRHDTAKGRLLTCVSSSAVASAGGDPSGWPTPNWSPRATELLMNRLGGVRTAILSATAPGTCILKGAASYKLARQLNECAAGVRDANPSRFGFFASLPSILDTEAALDELRYALDTLRADGVTMFTRYGDGNTYLGHPDLEPIWAELHRRQSVVFVHPTHPVDTAQVNARMPQPMVDYPHETTRAAMDMIVMGTRAKYPGCKVILSYAGGTLPYLISRIATPLSKTPAVAASYAVGVTHRRVMDDFRSFYYDLALSASPAVLDMALKTIPHDHILYGSDFPYAPPPAYPAFLQELESYDMAPELRDQIHFGNARKLIPRLGRNSSRL
ncbi:hypothetical protein HMPREF1624_01648 [Sporothrix schenckii ATCC 58251]|uniref:6-methylsalicylate decarboxylase n=1 Tax=Sporothrix schenckii (strain ATCC 58251 / de Perez 2211183) TaxID=1391915 RepID=U7Q975_SPOS1|nr:hypothetical protein HMPREF1624_01648 [Sporothrix schenckii ATCC 58251]